MYTHIIDKQIQNKLLNYIYTTCQYMQLYTMQIYSVWIAVCLLTDQQC